MEAEMKKFLVLYKSSTPASEMMARATAEQMQSGMEDWNRWAAIATNAIVDLGSPVGGSGTVGAAMVTSGDPEITGFSILQAESLAAVMKLLEDHPHLKTPGASSITAIEFLPMPGTEP
ncbi:MAG: hypothetical protein E6I33_02275 [Chloroflexi bacterium]|nr:MAG: hypothetical protein E6I33_02275 [Chloroflexota bacterium]